MKQGDVIEAMWDDHTFCFNTYGGQGITKMKTCGYFVKEDESALYIALTLQEGREPADVQVIDKRMLGKTRVIRREPT